MASAAVGLAACTKTATNPIPAATVRMSEFAYTPKVLTVFPNAKITVVNDGKVVHNWIIEKAGIGTADVQPGGTQTLDLRGIHSGTYTVFCDQPGHSAAGQTGTLVIRDIGASN